MPKWVRRVLQEMAAGINIELYLVLAITVGALVLRVAFVLLFGRTRVAFNDTLFYQLVGMSLAHGEGFTFIGHETVHWPPGYASCRSVAIARRTISGWS